MITEIFGRDRFYDSNDTSVIAHGLIDIYSGEYDKWVVIKPYAINSHAMKKVIIVPRWFKTDLASIPRAFKGVIGVNGRHRIAAIVHDFLYRINQDSMGYKFSRAKADKVFLDLCAELGVPFLKRQAMYLAVRSFGFLSFNKANDGAGGFSMFVNETERSSYIEKHESLSLDISIGDFKWII